MKLSEIVKELQCALPPDFIDREITDISSFEDATESSISFLSDGKYKNQLTKCQAYAVIVSHGEQIPNKLNLEVKDPYLAYARISQLFEDVSPVFGSGVHDSVLIDPSASVHESVSLGPSTIIGKNCIVEEHTVLSAHCIIEKDVFIGSYCRIDSGVIIRKGSVLGKRVIIQSNTVIGSEGFGNAWDGKKFVRIPCFGHVIIEDDVEIGACVTIDRGNFKPTIIRKGVRIDNLVQIAHNVEIDEHSALAAQVGISGSTKIGKGVVVGGQAGFVGHIKIGDGASIGGQAGVSKNVKPGQMVTGYPARDFKKMRRIEAIQLSLPEMKKELKKIRLDVEEIKRK